VSDENVKSLSRRLVSYAASLALGSGARALVLEAADVAAASEGAAKADAAVAAARDAFETAEQDLAGILAAPQNDVDQVHGSEPCSPTCWMHGGDENDPACTLNQQEEAAQPSSRRGWESPFNVDGQVAGVCSACGTPHPAAKGCGELKSPCFSCGACVECFASAVHDSPLDSEPSECAATCGACAEDRAEASAAHAGST